MMLPNPIKTQEKRLFYAAILTSYLAQSIEDKREMMKSRCDDCPKVDCRERFEKEVIPVDEKIQEQIDRYGFDPDNFSRLRHIETPEFMVMLEMPQEHILPNPVMADLMIIGNTEESEEAAIKAMPTGVLTARYSIFYGRPSEYTGNTPESVGYAFDMPKQVELVKAFLSNDPVLEAMLARDEHQITEALDRFNHESGLEPVLATPYLREALQIEHPSGSELAQTMQKLEFLQGIVEPARN